MKAESPNPVVRIRLRRSVFLCVSLLALILGALNAYHYYHRPTDDCVWIETENGVVISEVFEDGAADRAGLLPGDILLRIGDENATTSERAQAVLESHRAGETIPYLLLRHGDLLRLDLRIVEGGAFPPIVLIMILVGLVYWIIGFWIVWMRPLDAKATTLFWLFLSFMLYWMLNNVPPLARPLRLTLLILNTIAFTTIPGFFLYFFLQYPGRHPYIQGALWKKLSIFTPTFVLLVWFAVASFLQRPSPISIVMGIGLWGVYFLLALFRLGHSYRSAEPPFLRQQIRVLLWGLLIGLLPAFALIVNSGFRLNLSWVIYGVPLMGLIPLVFAYTVIRHRLMDIEFIVKKGFAYSLLTGLILIFYILLVQVPGRILQGITGFAGTSMLVLCTLLAAVAFTPLRERILRTVDRAFYREAYNYRETLRRFARAINTLIEPNVLVEMVLKNLVETMHIEEAFFFLAENGACCCCASYPEGRREKTVGIPVDSFFCEFLRKQAMPIRFLDLPESMQTASPFSFRPTLLVPLAQQDAFLGFLTLGEKRSGSPYSAEDLELLATLADQIAVSYENGRLHQALTDRERMKRELEIAHHIQMQSLPQENPRIPGYDIFGKSVPATEVGGDYYDYLRLPDGKLGLLVGDVSGKGTSAALYMSKMQGFFLALGTFYTSPRALLNRINRLTFENVEEKSFITLVAAVLHPEESVVTVARAGHTSILFYRSGERGCSEWSPPGIGLGLDGGALFETSLQEEQKRLGAGDALLLYSDGLLEAENSAGEEYGDTRLMEAFSRHATGTAEEIGAGLIEGVRIHSEDRPQHDDMTLIVIKKCG